MCLGDSLSIFKELGMKAYRVEFRVSESEFFNDRGIELISRSKSAGIVRVAKLVCTRNELAAERQLVGQYPRCEVLKISELAFY